MDYTNTINKLKTKLTRQTEAVIETSQHIAALEGLVQGETSDFPKPHQDRHQIDLGVSPHSYNK